MERTHANDWEQAVAQLARQLEYPATPALRPLTADDGRRTAVSGQRSSVVRRPSSVVRRLALAALALALLVAGLLAVPRTRAALLAFFARVGAIDVFIDETAPTAAPTLVPTDEAGASGPPPTTTSTAAAHSLALFELGEPTTLAEARRLADFPLAVPEALGEPDEVYVHRGVDLPAVTLVWRDEAGRPLSLTEIGVAEFARKFAYEDGVKSLRVGGRPAIWLTGPHRLQLLDAWQQSELLIASNVLIWATDEATYRLEGDLSEDEMIAIAESLEE